MNLFTKWKQSHGCRKQTYGYQGMGGGINWEFGIDIYTLLYIKQVTNNNLLYSTGNSTQYSVMIYKMETDSQTQKTNLWLPKGKGGGRDKLRVWDQKIQTTVYKVNKRSDCIAQGTIFNILQ